MFQKQLCSAYCSRLSALPSLCGKLLSQNTTLHTISAIRLGGYHLNGNEFTIAHTLPIIVLMYHSISGMCSFLMWHLAWLPFLIIHPLCTQNQHLLVCYICEILLHGISKPPVLWMSWSWFLSCYVSTWQFQNVYFLKY